MVCRSALKLWPATMSRLTLATHCRCARFPLAQTFTTLSSAPAAADVIIRSARGDSWPKDLKRAANASRATALFWSVSAARRKIDFYGKITKERTLRRIASSGEDRQDECVGLEKGDQDLVATLDGNAGFCRPHVFGAQRKDI